MSYSTLMQEILDDNNGNIDVVANKLNMTTMSVRKVLSGNVKMPSTNTLEKIAQMYKTEPIDIVQNIFFNYDDEFSKLTEEEKSEILAEHRYVAKLYMDGYNIETYPTINTLDGHSYTFLAIATKKREPNNKILVDLFSGRPHTYNGKPTPYQSFSDYIVPILLIDGIANFKKVDFVVPQVNLAVAGFVDVYGGKKLPLKFELRVIVYNLKLDKIIQTINLT